ncbi:immunoglobulin-like domain-containing protein [Domibacillus aminovorans]|uniref:immunoglobulin-like domain-containing protein n=1 Tax=Domibacillus aminovorans TaxID=29332 RepID=UPI0039F46ABF
MNDTWYEFPYKATMFTAEGPVLRPGGTTSLSLLANELKYELTPGEYRATLGGFTAPFEIIKP